MGLISKKKPPQYEFEMTNISYGLSVGKIYKVWDVNLRILFRNSPIRKEFLKNPI